MIKVSIIIPVYNGENTIQKCLDSVLAQTLSDIEVIVVNDGSTDKTAELLESYGDKIITINIKNSGQGHARNVGINAAKGEYVGFVDADDTVEKEMYEKMYEAAKKNNSQLVQCAIHDIHEDGTESIRSAFDESIEINNRADYIFDYFYKMKHTNEVCNKIIKKQFLTDNALEFSDTKKIFSEDFKLNMEMLTKLDKISFVSGGYYNYFIKSSGHCRSDITGRISKIICLFNEVLRLEMPPDVKKCFECVAAITILTYCAATLDEMPACAERALSDRSVRQYLHSSMTYRSSLKHSLLIFALLYMPNFVKLPILKKFYTF